jgi:hypothetical protein
MGLTLYDTAIDGYVPPFRYYIPELFRCSARYDGREQAQHGQPPG